MSTPPSRPVPSRSGDNESILVSPLNPLLPTGYRNIQPFQKGKGWHSNGRTPRHRVASTQADDTDIDPKGQGVVFPLLPGHDHARGSQGPDVSVVEMATEDDRQENEAMTKPTVVSPRPPNAAPRRPSRTDIRTNFGSFRSRALSGSPRNSSRPTSPATDENPKARTEERAVPGPDPVIMQQIWQEYAARSHAANRQVDAAAYHEKMNRRYSEQRALKERIAQLEQALEAMESERNEAQQQAEIASKQLELVATELTDSTATQTKTSALKPQAGEPANSEEKSYRERSFALERALLQTTNAVLTLQEQLRLHSAQTAERTAILEAQVALERSTNLELARQLRESLAGCTRVSEELVETRVSLEREQHRSQEIMEQTRLQSEQLLRRGQAESRMKLAVRSLGREALKQKMDTLMHRTMRAEQDMRVAQLETERVSRERDAISEQLEKVLSSHAIKYHSLGASGGVPGILKRSTQLTKGSRTIGDQLLLVQVLYEESEQPEDSEDGFSIHFVAYEPRSAQDDYLTFYLRDIQRLVPNHESYLDRHSVRRRERLKALAELLVSHVHAGFKNGHLVLAETCGSEAAIQFPGEQVTALQEQQNTQHVTVYRGTRYISVTGDEFNDVALSELTVTEAFAAATPQIWWLEVRAVLLGYEGRDNEALSARVDLRQLLTFCSTFASYRPSERHDSNQEDPELFAVHEKQLEPLFSNLQVVSDAGGVVTLEVIGVDDEQRPSMSEPLSRQRLSVEIQDTAQEEECALAPGISAPSTLTYQSVVSVGDVFYYIRLQELWDGELLLDITMDDPDTQQHFHRVLHEPQLAKLVERLIRDGALSDEDEGEAAMQVKFGLASVLHRPLCKLVVSTVRPVLPHPSQNGRKASMEAGNIDVSSLFGHETEVCETRSMFIRAAVCASLGWNSGREVRVITASRYVLADEKVVHRVLQDMLTVERAATQVKRQRVGVRCRGVTGFSLVQVTSAKLSYCGDVTIFDVLSVHDGLSPLPLVLAAKNSTKGDALLQLVLEVLGIEEDSLEIIRKVLTCSRTGDREDNAVDQDTPP